MHHRRPPGREREPRSESRGSRPRAGPPPGAAARARGAAGRAGGGGGGGRRRGPRGHVAPGRERLPPRGLLGGGRTRRPDAHGDVARPPPPREQPAEPRSKGAVGASRVHVFRLRLRRDSGAYRRGRGALHRGAGRAAVSQRRHLAVHPRRRDAGHRGREPLRPKPRRGRGPDFRGNHPELVTIYQPASQWVFAGLARLAALPHGLPADAVFRLGFSLVDLLAVGLLLLALRRAGRSAWWAALYAWHPLAITEVAGAGHQDPIGIAALLASLLLAAGVAERHTSGEGCPPGRAAWAAGCGAAMALSIAVKPVVAPVALLVLASGCGGAGSDRGATSRRRGPRARRCWRRCTCPSRSCPVGWSGCSKP